MSARTETQPDETFTGDARIIAKAAMRAERWRRHHARTTVLRPPKPSRLGEAGTARGDAIEIGAVDGTWVNPPPVTLEDGTRVRLFKDGQGLTAALAAIRAAKVQICLEVYIFHSDATGRAFANALAEKARTGVNVFVIYDSFGSMDTDPTMMELMRRAGVHLCEFHPVRPWDARFGWRPLNRDHRKLLVIDNQVAGLGGMNIGMEYGSGFLRARECKCDLWRDTAIGLTGPAAAVFAQDLRNRAMAKVWAAQFQRMTPEIVLWMVERQTDWPAIAVEQEIKKTLNPRLHIKGKLDRLETNTQGEHCVVDYKTGASPRNDDLLVGESV